MFYSDFNQKKSSKWSHFAEGFNKLAICVDKTGPDRT